MSTKSKSVDSVSRFDGSRESTRDISLLAVITYHHSSDRFDTLARTVESIQRSVERVKIVIVTNERSVQTYFRLIARLKLATLRISVRSPKLLGHPYLLTWSHLVVMRDFSKKRKYTHFLYTEDDLVFCQENFTFWLETREILSPYGLIPSFVRFEIAQESGRKFSTDQVMPTRILESPIVQIENFSFTNLDNPYQGCYLVDRELLEEHLNGESSSPETGHWKTRERAAQGLTFSNVPENFNARNVVKFDPINKTLDIRQFIHHSPNNYVCDDQTLFGSIPLEGLLE